MRRRQNPKGRQAKSKARLNRFEELASHDYQKRNETKEIFIPVAERLGNEVIEFEHVRKSYGDRLLIDDLLLFYLYEHIEHIHDIHVMLQREFAERLAARPGSRQYGRLTVMSAPAVHARILFHIPPRSFSPPPKVASSFVRLTPLREPPFPINDRRHYAAVVARAFQQRRKTMRHTFKPYVGEEELRACGIEPAQRPEELAPEAFARLANLPGVFSGML